MFRKKITQNRRITCFVIREIISLVGDGPEKQFISIYWNFKIEC